MAVTSPKSVASLMRKTLDRQTAMARVKLKFKENQIEHILYSYVRDGNAGPYNELVKVLQDCPITDENFRVLFSDSLSCVVVLGRELKQFVEAVCNVQWASRSEELIELYSHFILSLVTAHTYHCARVMESLVKLFKAEGESNEDDPNPDTITRWSNIHTIIAQIVAIMPMTSDLLMQTVVDQFPYYKAGCYVNRSYIHNLIWMSKYLPSLREQIMTAVINRMVIMDVNIVDRAKSKAQSDMVFEMEEDQDELSETLDWAMLEMLQWLQEEREPALETLCNVFERVILPTHGIRHVQFLVLYAVSISQAAADRVLRALWAAAAGLRAHHALATRRAAAAHLAGLLARCVRVPNSRLIEHLRAMCEWCHSYVTAAQETGSCADNAKHGAFHAVCHAVFYLVAFKSHHLFATKENVNFVESLNLARLVSSPLNPLRTCAAQTARAFSGVTRAQQVAYCQPVLERNARLALHDDQQPEHWFPYDPYTLPRSGKIIWPLCIEYKDWGHVGGEETQYAGMKRKLEAEDDDYLMMASPAARLASSLSNTVSPGFRTSESMVM